MLEITAAGSLGTSWLTRDSCARQACRSASAVGRAHLIQEELFPRSAWSSRRLSLVWMQATRLLPQLLSFPAKMLSGPGFNLLKSPSTYPPTNGISLYF